MDASYIVNKAMVSFLVVVRLVPEPVERLKMLLFDSDSRISYVVLTIVQTLPHDDNDDDDDGDDNDDDDDDDDDDDEDDDDDDDDKDDEDDDCSACVGGGDSGQ
ncbi:hypothetical protein ElyMa_002095200, partial [Elysia marginata]